MASAAAAASRWRVVFAGTKTLMVAVKESSASSSSAPAKRASTKKPTSTMSRPGVGIQKVVQVSPQLGNFVDASHCSRTQAVKVIWDYIKLHNLQNPENKREVFCDEKLKSIFNGQDKVGFQEIPRLLSSHFVKSG